MNCPDCIALMKDLGTIYLVHPPTDCDRFKFTGHLCTNPKCQTYILKSVNQTGETVVK